MQTPPDVAVLRLCDMSQPLTLPLWGCHLPTGQGLCELEWLQSAFCSECCGKGPTLFCPALVGQNAAIDEGSALGPEQWRRTESSGDHGICCCAQQSNSALDCFRVHPATLLKSLPCIYLLALKPHLGHCAARQLMPCRLCGAGLSVK